MKKILVSVMMTLLAFVLAGQASAEQWVHLFDDDQTAQYFADKTSIDKKGNLISVWVKSVPFGKSVEELKKETVIGGVTVEYSKIKYQFNVQTNQSKIIEGNDYAEGNEPITVYYGSKWSNIEKNSVEEGILEFVTGKTAK